MNLNEDTRLLLEGADREFYSFDIEDPDRFNLSRKAEKAIPNGYEILDDYDEWFELTDDNRIRPTSDEIDVQTIRNGHVSGHGPNESAYDIEMGVYAEGELQLNETKDQVVGGDLHVFVKFYSS